MCKMARESSSYVNMYVINAKFGPYHGSPLNSQTNSFSLVKLGSSAT